MSTMYYPDMGAPSACVDKFVQVLKNKYNFYIITKTYKANVISDDKYQIRYISNWMHRTIISANDGIANSRNVWLNKVKLMLVNAYKLIATQVCYPTAGSWESHEYYNELNNLSKEIKVDTVIAISNTVFTQLAMLRFKKKHSSIKYISYIYDPFSMNSVYYQYKIFKKIWYSLNRKVEEKIYNESDVLFFTNEMYRFALETFNFDKSKAKRIQFTLTPFPSRKKNRDCYSRVPIKIIFAGALYKKIRNPHFALSVISKIMNVNLDIFTDKGDCEDIINSFLSTNIKKYEFAPRERYIDMITNEYDILLNIANVSILQAPSKMVELLSTGRPIINFYRDKDSQYEMIEKYPLGLNIAYNEEGAIETVSNFCEMNKGKRISFEEVLQLFPENALKNQTKLLEDVIEA